MPHSGVMLKIDRGGGVAVFCGSTDIGQGSDSVLAYVVAEVLGVRPEDIRVVTADTDLTPVDLGSYSSRVTLMTGNAAKEAAEKLRGLLLDAAAKKLDVSPADLDARDRRIFVKADPGKGLAFDEAARLAEAAHGTLVSAGSYTPPKRAAKFKGAGVGPTPAYSYTACVVELDVDPATGEIRIDRVWVAHDGGTRDQPAAGRGPGRGLDLHGDRRGAHGRAGLPAPRAPQDPVDARVQEPDDAGDAGDPDDPRPDPRSRGALRRQGGGAGPAPAGHPGDRQRGVRRGRRADRRGADHAREDPEGARPEGEGAAAARGARAAARGAASPSRCASRPRGWTRRGARSSRPTGETGPGHDAAAAVHLPGAAARGRGGAPPRRARGGRDGGRGRDRPLPEHEAAPVRAEGPGRSPRHPGAGRDRREPPRGAADRRGDDADPRRRPPGRGHALPGARARGRRRLDAAAPERRHASAATSAWTRAATTTTSPSSGGSRSASA